MVVVEVVFTYYVIYRKHSIVLVKFDDSGIAYIRLGTSGHISLHVSYLD